jgi:hypothetical protein
MPTLSKSIIEAAIYGFEAQKLQIDAQIAELRAMPNGSHVTVPLSPRPVRRNAK